MIKSTEKVIKILFIISVTDVYVIEAFVDAKCSVITALTNFAKACPKEFIIYLKDLFLIFEELWDYVHDNVNLELIEAQEAIIKSIDEAEESIRQENNETQNTEKLYRKVWVQDIFPKFCHIVEERDTKEEVVKVLESIYNIVDHFEANLFIGNNTLDRIMQICNTLLNFEATCQLKGDDEMEEEDIDHDEQILSGVTDLFLIISEKLGNNFHVYFSNSFPHLQKYLSTSRTEADRSMVFGCIADVLKSCKISTQFYIQAIMNSVKENMSKNLKKKHDELYRHIAYLLGMLFESDANQARPYFEVIMGYLQTIHENSGKMSKDNVIAALCRITLSLGLNSESPLFGQITETIFKNAPLQNDTYENPIIFKFLVYMADKMDMTSYQKYFSNIMQTIKMLVLCEIKCGTSKPLLQEVKSYLELLNNNEVLKSSTEQFLSTLTEIERERFINTIRNS